MTQKNTVQREELIKILTVGELRFDRSPGCFICYGPPLFQVVLSITCESREDLKKIFELFIRRGVAQKISKTPTTFQLDIGACGLHKINLEKLKDLISKDLYIARTDVEHAHKYKKPVDRFQEHKPKFLEPYVPILRE